ncbi:MAG: Nif3-like dinuclear metal center hexameric protein [Armatimonadetes bacterium]|nr:Nif3-like dinuclear metal center hexameric protein [Armatimonadota bacterium]
MTVQDFDDFLRDLDPDARGDDSPDGLKWGDLSREVHAVGTTWMASMAVLRRAVEMGVNLIITHEPTFWSDGTPALPELERCRQQGVDVSFKTDFLDEHGISIIRAHNCWDRFPDYGIEDSLRAVLDIPEPIEYLGGFHSFYRIEPTTLGDLARQCKEKMGMASVRVAGDLGMSVEKLVLAYGSSSGTERYYRFWRAGADAVISGEQCEWSCVRPAIDMELGVIELGHSNTERFGMEGMARYLREHFPNIPIEHIPTGDSFTYV